MAPPEPAAGGVVRGRFAPSPSGPLHFGSIVTALGSFLSARAQGGEWLVRIENIDPPREVPGAADGILRDLERLGLTWDGPVVRQADRRAAYAAALAGLVERGLAYPCRCSRRDVGNGPYPGTCRDRPPGPAAVRVWRLRVAAGEESILDRIRGRFGQKLAETCGDFVIQGADGWPTYHLAVVVDDAWQGITEIVRGGDLLDSAPRQRWLQHCLAYPEPAYAHLPLAIDTDGLKLSKQTRAHPVAGLAPDRLIDAALRFLNHTPPDVLAGAPASDLLRWATANWSLARVPRALAVAAPALAG